MSVKYTVITNYLQKIKSVIVHFRDLTPRNILVKHRLHVDQVSVYTVRYVPTISTDKLYCSDHT